MRRRNQGSGRWSPRDQRALGPALLLGVTLLAGAGTAAAQAVPPTIDELIAKATRQGALRVIVELRPEGSAPYTRKAITQAQDRVLQDLSGTTHRVVRRYTTIPYLGLSVSADALRRLAGSLFVGGIREDGLRTPQ